MGLLSGKGQEMNRIEAKDFNFSGLPPKRDGWNHTDKCLCYVKGEGFIVAYYHYGTPESNIEELREPHWVSFKSKNYIYKNVEAWLLLPDSYEMGNLLTL